MLCPPDARRVVMNWFRSNIQHGSRLALLALALQFVLSFGHFHARRAGRAGHSIRTFAPPDHGRWRRLSSPIPTSSPATPARSAPWSRCRAPCCWRHHRRCHCRKRRIIPVSPPMPGSSIWTPPRLPSSLALLPPPDIDCLMRPRGLANRGESFRDQFKSVRRSTTAGASERFEVEFRLHLSGSGP